jgi:transforming growth factor-beta-induced protein
MTGAARWAARRSVRPNEFKETGMSALVMVVAAGLAASVPCVAGGGCAVGSAAVESADKTIVDTAIAAGQFKALAAALKAADWAGTLEGKGPFTVFAPTDEAFAKLPPETLASLMKPENKEKLAAILTYHVVSGKVPAAEVMGMMAAPTLNGQRASIKVKDGKVWLDGKARVVKTDIACSNGVIHVIDTVLMPSDKDIVETAMDAGSFTTLARALKAADLVGTLRGNGPFTVFAPTDGAFAKLPPETLASLMKPENKEKLAAILKFHVLPAAVYSDQAVMMTESIKTLQGTTFSLKVKDGLWIGNDKAMAKVVSPDIQASNGVIHVIDTIIMPR